MEKKRPLAYKTTLWLNDRQMNNSHGISIQTYFCLEIPVIPKIYICRKIYQLMPHASALCYLIRTWPIFSFAFF